MAITEVDTAVFIRAVSFAPNNWLMMTEQPVLLPSATAMKIIVMGNDAPTAASASSPTNRPATTLSATLYSCWNTALSSMGMVNRHRMAAGLPWDISVIKATLPLFFPPAHGRRFLAIPHGTCYDTSIKQIEKIFNFFPQKSIVKDVQDAEKRGQKMKLLYLADLLRRETDEDHALSMSDILSRLEELGVHAERKSIYDDLRALEDYGMDIIATRGRAGGYQLAHREFELPELKLLVDAVQSSKFLSVKKSRELIRKLEGLASRWEAQSLQRQVYAVGRVKSMNESIYYSIDTIHTAISQDRQIAFRYFEWTMEKNRALPPGRPALRASAYRAGVGR